MAMLRALRSQPRKVEVVPEPRHAKNPNVVISRIPEVVAADGHIDIKADLSPL